MNTDDIRSYGLRSWLVYTYALRPGWEISGDYDSRQEAREIRQELISTDGYPPEFVLIRHRDHRPVEPTRRPPKRLIEQVQREIAASDALETASAVKGKNAQ